MDCELKTEPEFELSCLGRYRRIIYLVRVCARICGADITDPDYRLTWLTYTMIILLFNFYCCTFYTIYVSIAKDGDFTIILQTSCFLGAAVQAIVKLFCFIAHRAKVRESQSFLDNTYMEYEKREGNYQNVLLESIAVTMRCIKLFVFIYVCLVVGCGGIPIIYYAIYKEKIMIMQFLLPGLDPNTNTGYGLLFALHLLCLILGAFGNFACDMYLLIFVGNTPLLKNILRCKFEDFNKLISQPTQPTKQQIHYAMMDIVLWHKQYLSLLDRTESIFFIIIIAHIFSSVLSVMSSMYCLVIGVWPAAPFFLMFAFGSLYLYCALGTVVENSNEDCAELIYTDCLWYELPISEQRSLLLMLRNSQSTASLSVASMMPLTVATALQLTKACYSMLMLLLSGDDRVGDDTDVK